MTIDRAASNPLGTPEASPRTGRRQRIAALAVAAGLVCSGATSCSDKQVALSAAAIAAVIVVTTVVITHEVGNQVHTLQGCVFTGPGGMELRTSDSKVYALEGESAALKVGDRFKIHGSKLKKTKGSTKDQVFVIDRLRKDYGPCPANFAASATQAK